MEKEPIARRLGAESEEELKLFTELAADLALAGPLTAPRPSLKSRLMERLAAVPSEPQPGVFILKATGMSWKPTRFPGVDFKSLFYDQESKMRTVLLRMAPGARYPQHRHAKPEQCLVLSGDVDVVPGVTISQGDFEWATPGTVHAGLFSRNGCELLIVASAEDEVMD